MCSQTTKAALLVGLGLGRSGRRNLDGSLRILTFHGLREDEWTGSPPIDQGLHLPVSTFEAVCHHLVEHYHVISLLEAVIALQAGRSLPKNAVALTFDDGYASNHHLALPILQACGLPATVFLTTGFVDGRDSLWFQCLDHALATTKQPRLAIDIGDKSLKLDLRSNHARRSALQQLLARLKRIEWAHVEDILTRLEDSLETTFPQPGELPVPMRPLNWDEVREMQVSGLIEFGAHTDRHPILSGCTSARKREEIFHCANRMESELRRRPSLFAYPNGGMDDVDEECEITLREARYVAAFTTDPKPVVAHAPLLRLPRFGSPESVIDAEATVSGAFTMATRIKQQLLPGR
jgi:peptidoglycan/xylan/chitin deacetylase (PgdA/CDA1 family)